MSQNAPFLRFGFSPDENGRVYYCILDNPPSIDDETLDRNLMELHNVTQFIGMIARLLHLELVHDWPLACNDQISKKLWLPALQNNRRSIYFRPFPLKFLNDWMENLTLHLNESAGPNRKSVSFQSVSRRRDAILNKIRFRTPQPC